MTSNVSIFLYFSRKLKKPEANLDQEPLLTKMTAGPINTLLRKSGKIPGAKTC